MVQRFVIGLAILCVAALAGGCARQAPAWMGPSKAAPVRQEPWRFDGAAGRKLVTPHYIIYTTVSDDDVCDLLPQLMEGGCDVYGRLSPGTGQSTHPMECFLFQTRDQWATFTRSRTGTDAAVYLQINRGGYTVKDWYVAYFIGDLGTLSVAAHEGWHQFVARHFKSRLPPFLEEGLACMFEEVRWESNGREGPLPRWNFAGNRSRLVGLRNAIEGNHLVPLPQLVAMHAGQVVDQPPAEIEAFYAQSWAFARFLWDAEGGARRRMLRRILRDAAAGTLYPAESSRRTEDGLWDPDTARPMLEYYLREDLEKVDPQFQRYMRQIALQGYRPSDN